MSRKLRAAGALRRFGPALVIALAFTGCSGDSVNNTPDPDASSPDYGKKSADKLKEEHKAYKAEIAKQKPPKSAAEEMRDSMKK